MENHHFIVFATGFALGWLACHLFTSRRRAEDPKKRSRAIPSGTEATRKPRKPKKAPQDAARSLPGIE